MIRLTFTLAARLYGWLDAHTPTNRLDRRIRTRPTLKGCGLCLLAGLACLAGAAGIGTAIRHGGPGWCNLVVLWLVWDGFKLLWLAPIGLVALARRGS